MLSRSIASGSRFARCLRSLRTPASARLFSSSAVSTSARFACEPDSPLLTELKDNILTVTFNRPATFNAMTEDMGNLFQRIMADVSASVTDEKPEDVVKAVLFTGAGKAFSSGGDLQFLLDRSNDTVRNNMEEMTRFYSRFLSVRKVPVPTIAAINGPCVGAGACFALACDMRLIADSTYMGFTFSKLGLHPGLGATHFLPRIVGPQTANRLLLTGDMISGPEAKAEGLVVAALPADELLPAARELAGKLVANTTVSQLALLRTLRAQQDEGLDKALLREADSQAHSYQDPVYKANVLGMINKSNKK